MFLVQPTICSDDRLESTSLVWTGCGVIAPEDDHHFVGFARHCHIRSLVTTEPGMNYGHYRSQLVSNVDTPKDTRKRLYRSLKSTA